jgi:hypothetical protein
VLQIAIDDQVFAEIQRRAIVYVDKEPNDTLRRLLGLDAKPTAVTAARTGAPAARRGRREQKVQLSALVASGLLTRGETLTCVDYSGKPIPKGTADVGTGNKLVRHGRRASMSALAIELLREAGHLVEVARGPAHWRTAEGKTVLELWRALKRTTPPAVEPGARS